MSSNLSGFPCPSLIGVALTPKVLTDASETDGTPLVPALTVPGQETSKEKTEQLLNRVADILERERSDSLGAADSRFQSVDEKEVDAQQTRELILSAILKLKDHQKNTEEKNHFSKKWNFVHYLTPAFVISCFIMEKVLFYYGL